MQTTALISEATAVPATLVALLREHAAQHPNQHGYTFLLDGETAEAQLTYAQLDQRVRGIAAHLQALGLAGEPALLLYPPGLEYIAAFFGCLYAGVVAVPAYPPNPARLERTLPRLRAMIHDAQPAIALTTAALLPLAEALAAHDASLALPWLASDTIATAADAWRCPDLHGDTLAFLQYTSGSTATPKGVMLTHRNLLHNSALIHDCFGHSAASQGVIWLPPYHDMGLIGGIIQPLYGRFPVTLMSPVDFLQRPLRWLQAITRTRATTSGGPNFAYDLCVRKITPAQRATLDLSSWQVAFNGAEPINPATLDRFAETFAPCGFRRAAFVPCYGLAEATLIVSSSRTPLPTVQAFQSAALAHAAIAPVAARDATDARTLVGAGCPLASQRIVIADPDRLTRCPPDQLGEIWLAGPSVAAGYWQQPEATAHAFQARLADSGDGPFLRTGDLGFLHDGELFIAGRLKDLIIIRGRNHYPQDIELTVAQSDPALRPGCGAAFAVEVAGAERLVIVQEIERQQRHADPAALIDAIRQAVAQQHDVHAYAVVLIKTGSIHKTSSGKVQRHAVRAAYLTGNLDVLGSDVHDMAEPADDPPALDRTTLLALAPAHRPALDAYLRTQIARVLGVAAQRIAPDQSLPALGLDSVQALELQHAIETDLGVVLSTAHFLREPTLGTLAEHVLALLDTPPATALQAAPAPADTRHPLAHGQRALWFMHKLAPESTTNTLAFAARLPSALDLAALRRAVQQLIEQHATLRTSFASQRGTPFQQVHEHAQAVVEIEDAADWSASQLHRRLAERARQPFNLAVAPLLRVGIYTRAPQESILLLALPHIVADFWSLTLLMRELCALYAQEHTRAPQPTLHYTDYVRWEADMLAGPAGEQHWDYWRHALAGPLPDLHLPTDRPRPAIQTYHAAAEAFMIGPDLTRRIKALGESTGATLFMTLLAAFQLLLHHYSDQDNILVGAPVACRSRAEFAGMIGTFAKPVVLRARIAADQHFSAMLEQVRQTVLSALEHQDFPFALLVERLCPQRDPSRAPLFQAMFNLLAVPQQMDQNLTAYALSQADVHANIGALPFESLSLDWTVDQFDLTLLIAEQSGELGAALHYNTDLFDQRTITRMAAHYTRLLAALVAQPAQPISAILATLPQPNLAIMIAATFTAEPLADSLNFWTEQLNLPATLRFAPYNQVFQQLLDPASLLATNRHGVNICLLRLEDWAPLHDRDAITRNVEEFLHALAAQMADNPATYLVGICPAAPAAPADPATQAFVCQTERLITERVAALHGTVLDIPAAITRYQVQEVHDPFTDELGHIPFTPECFAALGTLLVRTLFALQRPPFKVIALDCDQTLWGGICGEDGPLGVRLDAPYIALQRFLVEHYRKGMLLCLCTKNNLDDVREVFRQRPEMLLKLEYFTAMRCNWSPKSENLAALADELQLSLDSFLFLDDSAIERAEVRARCPAVLTLELPPAAAAVPAFLEHVWAFDQVNVTQEDQLRGLRYAQNREREQLRAAAPSLAAFLGGLDLVVALTPAQPAQLARVASLTQRTNQFNATTIRRTERAIAQLLATSASECWVAEVRDRFGDYGLVGVLIFAVAGAVLSVDTFLLSCRALGRNVEDQLLIELARLASERGCTLIDLPYQPTQKNAPFGHFLNRLGLTPPTAAADGGYHYALPVELARGANWPTATPAEANAGPAHSNGQASTAHTSAGSAAEPAAAHAPWELATAMQAEHIQQIAAFQTASQILSHMRAQKRSRPDLASSYVAPRNTTEDVLAAIWAEVLGVERVGIHDNFFELGGHSLQAIQIISRLDVAFRAEIPLISVFFEQPTVAGLAAALVQSEAATGAAEQTAQILQDVMLLSDDEVDRLLQEKQAELHAGVS
jgi:FkbH-like protein